MPRVKLPREVCQALEEIVWPENISGDPTICQTYARGGYGTFLYDKECYPTSCVVLPGSVKEVQEVVKIAN